MVKNWLLIMQHLFFLNIEGFYFLICYSLICGLHSQYSRSFFPTSYYLEYEFAFGVFYVSSCYKEWNLVEFFTYEMKMAVYNYKTLLNNYFSYFKPKHFFFRTIKGIVVQFICYYICLPAVKKGQLWLHSIEDFYEFFQVSLFQFIVSMSCLRNGKNSN